MQKRLFLGLVVLLVSIISVAALDDYEVIVTPITSIIFTEGGDDFALANVTIINNMDQELEFSLNSPNAPDWDIYTDPRNEYIISLLPNESKTVRLVMRPLYIAGLGSYKVLLDVNVKTIGDSLRKIIPVEIVSGEPIYVDYLPDVRLSAEISSETIDPREQLTVTINIKNNNPRNVDGLNLVVSSKTTSEQRTLYLGHDEQRKETFILTFDPLEKPKKDAVNIVASYVTQEKTYAWEVLPIGFTIEPYTDLKKDISEEGSFLQKTTTIVYNNVGNTERSTLARFEVSPIASLFTKTDPPAKLTKEEDGYAYFWNVNLGEQQGDTPESITITIDQNYRIILYIVIIIVLVILVYYWKRSPIVISKSIAEVKRGGDEKSGGIHRMKVIIHIRNRTKHGFEQIKVVDRVPNITEIESDFDIGTLKPSKVLRKQKKATLVIWNLHSLEPFEERIITYQLRSKLHIIGGIELPATKVKFKDQRGVSVTKYSNKTVFNEGQ
ncbi:MAG: hypothetical protein ABIH34_00620 [Nanoarchaeota archaeon]